MKKSLIGLPFNRNENSTEGIEVDPSIFQVHADQVKNWQPIDKSERGLLGCSNDVAQMVVEKLWVQKEDIDAEIQEIDQLKKENCTSNSGAKAGHTEGEKRDDSFVNQVCLLAYVLYFNPELLIGEIGGSPTITKLGLKQQHSS